MNAILTMAAKEIREASRNRWVLATTLLLAGPRLELELPRKRADRNRRRRLT